MKASKQRKMMRAIVSNKGLQHRESARITAAHTLAYENRSNRTAKMLNKQMKDFMKNRGGLAGWA